MSEIPEKLYQKCILCTLVLFPTCLEMKKNQQILQQDSWIIFFGCLNECLH